MLSLDAAFRSGVAVGLAVAVPIGPMGLLCIQRTLAFGLMAGLAIGLAAATIQVAYGIIAVLGLGPSARAWAGAGATALSLLSAALLFWFGLRILSRKVELGTGEVRGARSLLRAYADALTLGVANPLTVVLFFAVFPALAVVDATRAPALVGGVFAGVIGWYVLLSSAVALCRKRLSQAALNLTNKAAGLVLAGLGILIFANAFGVRL
jgi:threonine/homoserine/homoserine lactone efflux protein